MASTLTCLLLTVALAPGTPPRLDAALAAVQPARIESDAGFLASEALGGRGTPSPGLDVASLFLRARLERLGYEPGARDGWFHEYPLVVQRIDAAASRIELVTEEAEARLEFGSDYFLRSSELERHDLRGAVVSIGDGSDEDLARAEVAGRWALLLDEGRPTRRALEVVAERGGLGVLCAAGKEYRRAPYAERYAPYTRGITEGRVTRPDLVEAMFVPAVPRLWLSRDGLARVLELAGRDADAPPEPGEVLALELREVRVPDGGEVTVRNVCGFLPGRDPELAHEALVVTAHYDHLGTRDGRRFPGADDNASGTAGLLALAAALRELGPLDRSVLLLWTSGEEKGLWGAEAWSRDVWLPNGARPVANVNLDMIGRGAPGELYLTPSPDHHAYGDVAEAAHRLAPLEGFEDLVDHDSAWRRSDHFVFASRLRLPVVFLSSGDHEDYHLESDTADKLDGDKIARTVRLVVRLLAELGSSEL